MACSINTAQCRAKLLIYLSFVPGLAIGFIYTDLSFFLTTVRGFSALFMGLVIMVMGMTTVVTAIPLGILADRYGRRKFLIVGNILASVTLAAFALTTNEILLIAAAVVEGTTEAAFASAGTALLAEKAGDRSRTAAFSLSSFLGNMAWGLGGFAIPVVVVIESLGFSSTQSHIFLYVVLAAMSLAVTPLLLRVGESRTSEKTKSLREFLPRKSRGVILRYAATSLLVAFGAGLFVPLMTQWFKFAFGVSDAVSGPVIGISGFLIAAATLGAPNLARRLGVVRAIVLTEGLSMVFMVAVPLSPSFPIAGGVYIIRSFLMNVAGPLSTSLIMGLVDPSERGAASGLSAAIWRFPNSLGAGIGGALMGAGFLALPFYIASVLYIAAIALFWVLFRDAKLPEETPNPS
ncbi:MAG: MFS transporter [Nitrososphaerales archaeon]|nr:MFS transporter [Nitrososphaerales archaeon]